MATEKKKAPSVKKKSTIKKDILSSPKKQAEAKKKTGSKTSSIHRESYEITIQLQEIKPPIRRRFVVSGDMKVNDFHKVIQTVMGWGNSHLHQFIKKKTFYLPRKDEMSQPEDVIYTRLRVKDLLNHEKDTIEYEYDFGDGWTHTLKLEKIHPDDRGMTLPYCIEGVRNCPPEDCGGPFGYQDFLSIISNPDHEEYEETVEWIGEEFDPELFDIEEVNERLHSKDYGTISFDI